MYAKITGTEFHLYFKGSRGFFDNNYIYPPRIYVESALYSSKIKIEFKWQYKHTAIENSTRCYICGDTILIHMNGKVHPCRCGRAEEIIPYLLSFQDGTFIAPLVFNNEIFEIQWNSIPPSIKEILDYHRGVVTYYYNNSTEALVIEIPNGTFNSKLLTHICPDCGKPRAYRNKGCQCLSMMSISTHDRRQNFLESSCHKMTQVENCIVGI